MSLREQALSALRKLGERRPSITEINNLFTSIRRGDHRTTAILGGSIVEEAVKQALLSQFRKLNSDETDRLFGPDQPLGTFSAKNKLAYALDLCDRRDFSNLESVRVVRNAFAHVMKPISFKTSEVTEVCYHLHLPDHIPKARGTPRPRFLWVVGDLSEKFWTIAFPETSEHEPSHGKLRLRHFPNRPPQD